MRGGGISVLMACRNVGAYIDEALTSVREQSHDALQIIVVDDGSTDDTADRVRAHAAEDGRVLLVAGRGEGPGAARNLALAQASEEWVAVVDGDDVLHPRRFETMLARARETKAPAVMDNVLSFYEDGTASHPLIDGEAWQEERWIDLPCFIDNNRLMEGGRPLGYLKPLLRRDSLNGLRYDETLRIGEDYDFIARFLAAGHQVLYLPQTHYFYRRRAGSTSHRLREQDVVALLAAAEALEARLPDGEAKEASRRRRAALVRAKAFCESIDALKGRRPWRAVKAVATQPGSFPLVCRAFAEAATKRLRRLTWKPLRSSLPSS